VALALVLLVGLPSLRPGVYLPAHRHCIKIAVLQLLTYADANGGRFPDHPTGYGDALLLVDEEIYPFLTGPGYDPAVFREAKAAGRGLPEEACGRVYVRGLTTKVSSRVALLFDKRSTPGGDHCHWPMRLWAPRGREVVFPDATMEFVRDGDWPAFAAEQIELLVEAGIPRAEAERLYAQVIP
jgi:hypothetical protein